MPTSPKEYCLESGKPPPLKEFGDRPRLDFKMVAKICPELAARTKVVRGRIKDLRDKFHEEAKLVQRKFRGATMIGGGAALAIVATGLYLSMKISVSGAFIGALAAAVTVVVGVAYSMGRDRQFEAMIAARWAVDGLLTKIDNHLLQICFEIQANGLLSKEQRKELTKNLANWSQQLEDILLAFGQQTGKSLNRISSTTLPVRGTGSNQ